MQAREGRQLVKLDSAVITNGEFQFKGTKADSLADVRYLTYKSGENSLAMDFFLENGNIQIHLSTNDDAATGTPTNDAYQVIRAQVNELTKQMSAIYKSLSDSTLTDEQREEASKNIEATEEKMMGVMKEGITNNITNAAGIYLLKQNFYYMEVEDLDPLMAQIPAAYANDETIIRIKDNVEKMKATAVGQKFTDFEMQTPDGKAVKLSDYVGKGKVTLIDFWASWCGPCRREMPNLVEAYKKYKNKGFEIVGVSLDRDAEAWKNGIKQLKITWPQMSDLKYWDCEGAKLYAVSSIPHTVLVDGEGTILARGLHGEELQEKIAEALK